MTAIDLDQLIGYAYPPITVDYSERDVALYALGVGAPADWRDPDELRFVYENSAAGFAALPTIAATYPNKMIDVLMNGQLPGFTFNPLMLVHGEQTLRLSGALPVRGQIVCQPRVSALYDKGSGALMITDVPCYDSTGREVAFSQSAFFIRGAGGFGGERGPSGDSLSLPERSPDAVIEERTLDRQALIYRLSGDINPLHADPMIAAFAGFDRPLLHGLATYGFAGRAVLKRWCANDPARLRGLRARFNKPVFPGDTLRTEMWQISPEVIGFQTRIVERDEIALSAGRADIASG